MGASSQTYNFFCPEASISGGTGMPQSKSRVIARGCKPPSSHDLHCPKTWGFQVDGSCVFSVEPSSFSSTPSVIHRLSHLLYSFNFKYQCVVFLKTGVERLKVERMGGKSSIGLIVEPHLSHWSPSASGLPHFGHTPFM